jgi:hypothetical protein
VFVHCIVIDHQYKTNLAAEPETKAPKAEEKSAAAVASADEAEHKAYVQEEETPVATAAPLLAPHVKRSHEVPVFVTQERDQPSKKARVDEPAESVPQSDLAVPGRFPTPSTTDSAIPAQDAPVVAPAAAAAPKTVVSQPSAAVPVTETAPVTQTPATAPTEAAISAPAATEPVAKDTAVEDKTAGAAAASADKPAAAEIPTEKEAAPPTGQEDASARPIKPVVAADTAARAEQTPDKAVSKPAAQETAQKEAKKGGFVSWIKRKLKGSAR